ncbi:TPA: proline--tRNA ligase [Candidatus Peribacteria bacterium]|nr:MAG: proline--tRNA ligase [Candidatus Peribacteria bacterium RIFOXYD2_FULL_58_15]HAI98304.1 proline--tRNA ligase [Candidatus Peribacteria bacterium]HAS33946.1 proline--tRNA ligase [Candidatus Peribacteria bacterium]
MSEQTRITPRSEGYSRWYLDVIAAARLASYSDVPGCMIIEPNGCALWERVTEVFDARIKATGHRNVKYPALIPLSLLQRETEHVEGFAPELATLTHLGGTKLEDPLVLRPTSETIMYADFAKKVASRSDLPIKINQWCNIWRMERRTLPFLRTFEFYWQEGHTAHATEAEAQQEVLDMLQEYRRFVEGTLAIPCIPGRKPPGERFAGAEDTYSIEAMMQNGKGLQSATSHYLGQKFSRAFGIQYSYGVGQSEFVYQTSWGMSTRIIGAIIMSHSDDKGLVLPPRIAPVQAAILLIIDKKTSVDEQLREGFLDAVRRQLDHVGVTYVLDATDRKLGLKQYDWEKQGIPLRIVVGASEIAHGQVMLIRRDTSAKMTVPLGGLGAAARLSLEEMQSALFTAAQERLRQKSRVCTTLEEIRAAFKEGNFFVHTGWAGSKEDEKGVKEAGDGVTLRCIPLERTPQHVDTCFLTGRPAEHQVILAKAY